MNDIEEIVLDDGAGPVLQMLRAPAQRPDAPAMLMVHGAYTSARCWEGTFMPYFQARGFDVYAVSLRGHGSSAGRSSLDMAGLSDFLDDIQRAACHVGRLPVLVASSMGGLLVQRWLAAGRAARAAILIGSIPPSGLSTAAVQMAFSNPFGFAELTRLAMSGSADPKLVSLLTPHPLPARQLKGFYKELGRESTRALWESTWAPMVGWVNTRCPVLAIHGEADKVVPVESLRLVASRLQAESLRVPDVGHLPMVDEQWLSVADGIDRWMQQHNLRAVPAVA